MGLYCMKCKKFIKSTNKKCKCDTSDLISVTKNMLPVANIIDDIRLKVASAFCLTDTHHNTLVKASVYFKRIYPEILLQDLPNSWYWTDYINIDGQAICSCIAYDVEYVDTGALSLDEFVKCVINDLVGYLATRNKHGLRAVLTLLES